MMRLRVWQKLIVLFFLFCFIGPFAPLTIASLSFRWGWPDLLPSIWWWEKRESVRAPIAWDYIIDPVSRVIPALGNTVLIAALVTVFSLIVAVPAARVVARQSFRGKSFVEFYLMMPLIVPEIAVGIGMLVIFLNIGLHGSIFAIVLAHMVPVLPYTVRMLVNVYGELDKGLLEQARLLGAGRRQILFNIEIPLILPGLLAAALFSILISTNIFLLTFYMGKGQVDTLATLLFAKISAGGALDPVSAALTLIITLPGLLFLVISNRVINENVFVGGIDRS